MWPTEAYSESPHSCSHFDTKIKVLSSEDNQHTFILGVHNAQEVLMHGRAWIY